MIEDLSAHYAALTTDCGVVTLEGWSSIRVAGADRARFVHNMCTQDVVRLAPGEFRESFFVDVKGKIVAHGLIVVCEKELLLVTVPEQAERLIMHLDRYIIREEVALTDHTQATVWAWVSGAASEGVLGRLSDGTTSLCAASGQHVACSLGPTSATVLRSDWCWPRGYLLCTAAEVMQPLIDSLVSAGAVRCAASAGEVVRIESGRPLYGTDFNHEHFPQEVGRDPQAISFHKGCYLGQETVARIDALGHVNRQLALVQLGGPSVPPPGEPLMREATQVGAVTSSCWSPWRDAPLALAMIRRGANETGTELAWKSDGATVIEARRG